MSDGIVAIGLSKGAEGLKSTNSAGGIICRKKIGMKSEMREVICMRRVQASVLVDFIKASNVENRIGDIRRKKLD